MSKRKSRSVPTNSSNDTSIKLYSIDYIYIYIIVFSPFDPDLGRIAVRSVMVEIGGKPNLLVIDARVNESSLRNRRTMDKAKCIH